MSDATKVAADGVHVAFEATSGSLADKVQLIELRSLKGREAIGELFEFQLELVVKELSALSVDDLMGAAGSLVFRRGGEIVRRLHGFIKHARHLLDAAADHDAFSLTLVPTLWMLDTVHASQVYVNRSIPDLIESKLNEANLAQGDGDFDFGFDSSAYPAREFVAQYKESELSFILRWCEHLGISVVFCHDNEAGTDQVLFVDEMNQFPERQVAALPLSTSGRRTGIYQLSVEKNFAPQTVMLRDYNYRQPGHELEVSHANLATEGRFVMGGRWVYGTHYRSEEEGLKIARARAGELGGQQIVYGGESDCAELASGHIFSLGEGDSVVDEALLITEIEHEAVQSVFGSEGGIVPYANRFRAVPVSTDFRPVRHTPWPRIDGLQTGIVQSSDGDIDATGRANIDDEGRYTVRFLFDTPDAEHVLGSAPVRMLQPSAGEQYGMHFPVKPGVEVLLAFVDGNPDRPLIVGAAPNPTTPSPVTAGESTKSRIRTASGAIIEFGGN